MIAVLIVFLESNEKKESDENNIKTRPRQDRDKTVLLLETQQKRKETKKRPEQDIK